MLQIRRETIEERKLQDGMNRNQLHHSIEIMQIKNTPPSGKHTGMKWIHAINGKKIGTTTGKKLGTEIEIGIEIEKGKGKEGKIEIEVGTEIEIETNTERGTGTEAEKEENVTHNAPHSCDETSEFQ